jgi:endonuclease/exonuclease/phosphatase family metal-dependent hydrolase
MVKFIEVPQVNLRVMSLNMQFGSGPVDNENDFMRHIPFEEMVYNLQEIAELIYEVNPDVVCLQEADFESSRTDYIDQPEVIQHNLKEMGLNFNHLEYGSCIDLDEKRWGPVVPAIKWAYENEKMAWFFDMLRIERGRLGEGRIKLHFGNAILSKFPLREVVHEYYFPTSSRYVKNFNIVSRRDERKSFLRCRVDYLPQIREKVPLYIINTHFENNEGNNRERQSKLLYQKLFERSGAHKILAGDFNATPYERDLERLLNHKNMRCAEEINPFSNDLSEIAKYNTYPAWGEADKLLDTIMTSKNLEIVDYFVHPGAVSDHLAVVCDVRINPSVVKKSALRGVIEKVGRS